MLEHGATVIVIEVLNDLDAFVRTAQQLGEQDLPPIQRLSAQVRAVKFEKVEAEKR